MWYFSPDTCLRAQSQTEALFAQKLTTQLGLLSFDLKSVVQKSVL